MGEVRGVDSSTFTSTFTRVLACVDVDWPP